MPDFKRVAVKAVSPLLNGTRTIHLDTYFPYEPGQAVQVQFSGDLKPRYFSLCSSPTESGSIAITVKAPEGTALAAELSALTPGTSTLDVNGPWGSFGLPAPLTAGFCFLAGGTGVTPFRSMIKFLIDHPSSAELRLMHSVRTEHDLLFREEFTAWASPRFLYTPIITGNAAAWAGARGRMNASHIQGSLPTKLTTFLLCGPPGFVGDTEKLLKDSLHVAPEHIRREQW